MKRWITDLDVDSRLSELLFFSAMLDSTVALGEDFVAMIVFSAMRGSTVALGNDFLVLVVLSAMLFLVVKVFLPMML